MYLAACSSPGTVALDAVLLQPEIITAHICTVIGGIQNLLVIHASDPMQAGWQVGMTQEPT